MPEKITIVTGTITNAAIRLATLELTIFRDMKIKKDVFHCLLKLIQYLFLIRLINHHFLGNFGEHFFGERKCLLAGVFELFSGIFFVCVICKSTRTM